MGDGARRDEAQAGANLAAIARRFQNHRGKWAKAALSAVREVLGPTDPVAGPGDDAAALAEGEGYLLIAGEAMSPPLVEADPRAAGIAAVVTNVNDVAAMGGRALAIVDQIVAPERVARRALEGVRDAARLYGVPVVGGHLTVHEGPAFVAASVVGRAARLLSATNVRAGQAVVAAAAIQGRMRDDFAFFSSLERGAALPGDVAVLRTLAEQGLCDAAKDVSMAGLLGSLAMLLEPTRCGAVVELDLLPRPAAVALVDWVAAFPSYGFLLCSAASRAAACCDAFRARGLAAEIVGEIDDTGQLRARLGGDEELLLDLHKESVTGLFD